MKESMAGVMELLERCERVLREVRDLHPHDKREIAIKSGLLVNEIDEMQAQCEDAVGMLKGVLIHMPHDIIID